MTNAVLILGATSTIAKACAQGFAKKGFNLFLAGREEPELIRMAADIKIRFSVDVRYGVFDAENYASHGQFLENVIRQMNGLTGALLAFGYLGEPKKAIYDFEQAQKIININFTGACSILNLCANYFAKQNHGFIVAISSVAGDRGRQSNYLYGSAKAGLNVYLEGLRNRLHQHKVRVITIKPGFVDTKMTFGLPGMFLVASPQTIGEKIVHSLDHSKDTVYLPWFWRYIMLIIKSIPEFIFKRLKL